MALGRRLLALAAALPGPLLAACAPTSLASAVTPRGGYRVTRDIRYAPHDRGLLDLYEPDGMRPEAPMLVFFHGGAWRSGGRSEYLFAAQAFTELGAAVAVPDYRLAPAAAWPDFVEDGAAAVALLRGRHAGPLVAIGHSAGAFIALAVALDPRWLAAAGTPGALDGAIGLAGPYAFGPEEVEYRSIFAAAPGGLARSLPEDVSPAGAPPILLLHGADDRIARPRQSTFLAERARAAGVEAQAVIYPGVAHIGIMAALASPLRRFGLAGAPVLEDVGRFLATLDRRPHPV